MNINEEIQPTKARLLQVSARAIDAANTEKLTLLDRFALLALEHILRAEQPEEFHQRSVLEAYAIATAIADRRGDIMETLREKLPLNPEDMGDLNG